MKEKEQKSKLDPFTERLDYWFGVEKRTLKDIKAQLASDSCAVSEQRLSAWWQARRPVLQRQSLLKNISTGAETTKALAEEFSRNAPPELELIIKLHRHLIQQLSVQAEADPKLLKLADQLTRTALEYSSGQTKADLKQQELALTNRRVKLLEQKAAAYDRAQAALKSAGKGGISPETMSRIERELNLL